MIKKYAKQFFLIRFRSYAIWLVLIAICLILAAVSNTFMTYSNLTNIARQVSFNIILACGMTLVIIAGGIDLSVGAILAFSSFIMADILKKLGLIESLFICLVIGACIGIINGLLVSRRKSMAFVVTLGTMTVWRSLAAIYSGGLPISGFPNEFRAISSGYFLYIPVPFWIALITVFACFFVLEETKMGKSIYAIGSNPTAARNCGVNVDRIIIIVYMIAGLLAALSGIILTSRLDAANAQSGQGYEMDVIAAVVIGGTSLSGGKGSIIGTLAGALIMGILRNGLNLLDVTSNWQQTAMGIVIIAAILWDKGDKPIRMSHVECKKRGDDI